MRELLGVKGWDAIKGLETHVRGVLLSPLALLSLLLRLRRSGMNVEQCSAL